MHRVVLIAAVGLLATGAQAQDVAVNGIKAQAFLERSGRWSDDLAAAKKPFKNLSRPDGDLGEPANSVLVTLDFTGPKNGEGSRNLARDMAQVIVKQTAGDVTKTLLYRAFGGFTFGADGRAYRTFMLDDATCAPLEIEVKVGRTRKLQSLDLSCEAPVVASADVTATGAVKGKPGAKR